MKSDEARRLLVVVLLLLALVVTALSIGVTPTSFIDSSAHEDGFRQFQSESTPISLPYDK